MTPMLLFSGVYFPVDQMPAWLADRRERAAAQARDRHRAAADARPDSVATSSLHVAVLLAYSIAAYYVAVVLTRRRLLK